MHGLEESILDINEGRVTGQLTDIYQKAAAPKNDSTFLNMIYMQKINQPTSNINDFTDFYDNFADKNIDPQLSRHINNTKSIISNIGKSGLDPQFDEAVEIILESEGYLSNHVNDKGGYTIYGISEAANPQEVALMKNMSQEDQRNYAINIYKEKYWDKVDGIESMDRNSALVAFDAAVNHGTGYANKMVRETGGNVNQMLEHRLNKYESIIANDPSQQVFEAGWNNRIVNLSHKLEDQPRPTSTTAEIKNDILDKISNTAQEFKQMIGLDSNTPAINNPVFEKLGFG